MNQIWKKEKRKMSNNWVFISNPELIVSGLARDGVITGFRKHPGRGRVVIVATKSVDGVELTALDTKKGRKIPMPASVNGRNAWMRDFASRYDENRLASRREGPRFWEEEMREASE